jgi:2,3-bisphosphoglycerate-independent phosphoglycerate mutase
VSFDERPWMKAAEITDALIAELQTGRHRTARVNYANGDMVGHTGNYAAAVVAVEAVDLALARLLPAIDALGGVVLITADHGNAEEMFETDKKTGAALRAPDGRYRAKTSHTLNPVPLILSGAAAGGLGLRALPDAGLGNIAATTVHLLGYEAPAAWCQSLLSIG